MRFLRKKGNHCTLRFAPQIVDGFQNSQLASSKGFHENRQACSLYLRTSWFSESKALLLVKTVATKYEKLCKCIQILYQSSEKCRVKHMVELAMQRSAVLLDRT